MANNQNQTGVSSEETSASYAVTFGALDVGHVFRIYRKGETALRQKVTSRSYVDWIDGPNGSRKSIEARTPVVRVQP